MTQSGGARVGMERLLSDGVLAAAAEFGEKIWSLSQPECKAGQSWDQTSMSAGDSLRWTELG